MSVWGSNHARKGCFILKRVVFHTEEGDVSYWAHCVAFYEFCERENSLEKKVRCGKLKKGNGQVKAVCTLGVTLHSHSHFSPSYTLASSLESFPSPKFVK